MINVLIDILNEIKKNGLKEGNHLYITFETDNKNTKVVKWLKEKFPKKMTIVIQYEYSNLEILKDKFKISLSFNNIITNLTISYNSILSFFDPYANFGLELTNEKSIEKKDKISKRNKKNINENNVINFEKFKKYEDKKLKSNTFPF